jgi:hypothetical protein
MEEAEKVGGLTENCFSKQELDLTHAEGWGVIHDR